MKTDGLTFGALSWREFLDRYANDVELEYVVDGLVPAGQLGFIAGQPKSGKTWFAIAMAVAIAAGRPVLGHFATPSTATRVLYVACEGDAYAFGARVSSLARGLGVDPYGDVLADRLHVAYKPRGINLEHAEWTLELIRLAEKLWCGGQYAVVVIVDTLRATTRIPENNEGAIRFAQLVANLSPLADQGVTVLFLHHFVKAADVAGGIGNMMSGSGALFGHADVVIGLKNGPGVWPLMVEGIGRDVPTIDPFGVAQEGDGTGKNGSFRAVDAMRLVHVGDVEAYKKASPRDIASFLAKQPNGDASPKAIRDQFDISEATLRDRREALEKVGVMYQDGGRFSRYYLAAADPAPGQLRGSAGSPPSLPRTPQHPIGGCGVVDEAAGSRVNGLPGSSLAGALPPLELDFDDDQAAVDD